MITIQRIDDTYYYLINGFIYLLPLRFRNKGTTAVLTAFVAQKMNLQLGDVKPTIKLGRAVSFSNEQAKSIVRTNKGLI